MEQGEYGTSSIAAAAIASGRQSHSTFPVEVSPAAQGFLNIFNIINFNTFFRRVPAADRAVVQQLISVSKNRGEMKRRVATSPLPSLLETCGWNKSPAELNYGSTAVCVARICGKRLLCSVCFGPQPPHHLNLLRNHLHHPHCNLDGLGCPRSFSAFRGAPV